jgi:hypothetical protein
VKLVNVGSKCVLDNDDNDDDDEGKGDVFGEISD